MNCGYWDIHNHLLPGIDDGSSCMEETMQLIRTEYEQGVYNIVFTPHYRPGMFQIKPEDREAVFHKVYESIVAGLQEAIEDAKSKEKKLQFQLFN